MYQNLKLTTMIMTEKEVLTASSRAEREEAEDGMFLRCICEMLENVEKKAKITNCAEELAQMTGHIKVIKRVLEQNLALSDAFSNGLG